jgi:hypothetical protein
VSIEALPCIICGTRLKNVWEDAENQPNDGVACTTRGNYGSTVYDPVLTAEFLEFNICDPCLVKAAGQDRIYAARTARPVHMTGAGLIGYIKAPYAPVYWRVGMLGYDDTITVDTYQEFIELGHDAQLAPGLTEDLVRSLETD